MTRLERKWRGASYTYLPWVNQVARDPRILDIVEDLLGPDLLVYTATFFMKEPGSQTYAAWHQDSTYFGLSPHEHVTAWIALTDANHEAGCMEVLPMERGAGAAVAPRGGKAREQHQRRR